MMTDRVDKATVLYCADVAKNLTACGDAGEIEEALRRFAATLSEPTSDVAPSLLAACQETLVKLQQLSEHGVVQMPKTISLLEEAIAKASPFCAKRAEEVWPCATCGAVQPSQCESLLPQEER
jgi:hypothetical protein